MAALTALLLITALITAPVYASGPLMGGWQVSEDPAITEEAQDAFNKALDGLVGAEYEPIALLATQVVAGTNYCFLCRITPVVPNPVPGYAFVYIYEDLQGNAKILDVQEIEFGLSELSDDPDQDVLDQNVSDQNNTVFSDETSFSPYDYTIGETANEEYLTYTFPDVRLYIPMEWENRFVVETGQYGVSFYQKASYDKYLEEGKEHGGFLFRFSGSEDESFRDIPEHRYLGYSENAGLHFYLKLPSDYRAYNDPEIRADYDEMRRQIDLIAENAKIAASLNFYPGESTDAGMS